MVIALENNLWTIDEYQNDMGLLLTSSTDYKITKPLKYYNINKILKYIPVYLSKKIDTRGKTIQETSKNIGVYSNKSFNNRGDMIYKRENSVLPVPLSKEYKIWTSDKISDSFVEYINKIGKELNKKNIDVIVTFSAVFDGGVLFNEEEIKEFEEHLKTNLNMPVILNLNDYIYDESYMYDTIYHCNNKGQEKRTKQLSNDILEYIKEKNNE